VALTGLDYKQVARLIQYREKALSASENATSEIPKPTNIYIDKFGEIAKRKISQPQKRLTNTEITAIIEEYKNGASTYVLATKYGCHRSTISGHLKKNGVKVSKGKIDPDQGIKEIVALYASGLKAEDIAKQVGIGRYRHCNGQP
jgi:hypothetical protein